MPLSEISCTCICLLVCELPLPRKRNLICLVCYHTPDPQHLGEYMLRVSAHHILDNEMF